MSTQPPPSTSPEQDIAALKRAIKNYNLMTPRHCKGTYPLEVGKAGLFYRNDDGSKVGYVTFF